MKSTRHLLANLNSHLNMPHSWATDTSIWLHQAMTLDEEFVRLPPPADSVRVVMDEPGRRASRIQIYEGRLLLATLKREPAPTGSESHSLFSTTKMVRVEWRCRQAGERRLLAELLLKSICTHTSIVTRYGVPHMIFTSDTERPKKTAQCLEWPEQHAAVMTRNERAYAPRQKVVQTSPTVCRWEDDIPPTVLLSFEP